MSIYGYGRVSILDQDFSIQHRALKTAGCEVVRAEKASCTRRYGRTELQVLLEFLLFLRTGDRVVVTRIGRLARSLKDLQDIVHELKAKGVALKATEQPVDTGSAAGKAFLDMLGVFAEFERAMIQERVRAGLARARANGKVLGRPKISSGTRDAISKALASGQCIRKVAAMIGVGVGTVQRIKPNSIC